MDLPMFEILWRSLEHQVNRSIMGLAVSRLRWNWCRYALHPEVLRLSVSTISSALHLAEPVALHATRGSEVWPSIALPACMKTVGVY